MFRDLSYYNVACFPNMTMDIDIFTIVLGDGIEWIKSRLRAARVVIVSMWI